MARKTAQEHADRGEADRAETASRTVAESAIVVARVMQPPDANVWGNVHGGAIMRLVDEAGGAVAQRHSRRPCVTVAMDSMIFKEPVYIGDLLTIRARLTFVGTTSMEVEARLEAENLRTGATRDAGMCHIIYVALDDAGAPSPVPPLRLTSSEEQARHRAAQERRALRQGRDQA
jgi:acyl-CoA hydrolase